MPGLKPDKSPGAAAWLHVVGGGGTPPWKYSRRKSKAMGGRGANVLQYNEGELLK